MAVLGEAYRILYVSSNRVRGLTDVYAVVLKPDKSQAGVYPMWELNGLFRGCYYYDYYSSTSDPEGSYFSLVVSPTEQIDDIVRFSLAAEGGGGSNAIVIPPTQLFARVINEDMSAFVADDKDIWSYVRTDNVRAKIDELENLHVRVSESEVVGQSQSDGAQIHSRLE